MVLESYTPLSPLHRNSVPAKNVWFDVDDVDSFQSSQLCILDNHGAKSIFPILHSLTGGIFLHRFLLC